MKQETAHERDWVFNSINSELVGTIRHPVHNFNDQIVVFIPGSFPQTRDGNVDPKNTDMFSKPFPARNFFKEEAALLSNLGVASFRFDKRGSGHSGGRFDGSDLNTYVEDVKNAIQSLKKTETYQNSKFILIGQSEGSTVALLFASRYPKLVDLVIWQGGVFQSVDILYRLQAKAYSQKSPIYKETLRANFPYIYYLYEQLEDYIAATIRGDESFTFGDSSWSYTESLNLFKSHLKLPANTFMHQVQAPVVILHGEKDMNVPASEAELAFQLLKTRESVKCELKIFAGLEHSFRRVPEVGTDFIQAMSLKLDPDFIEFFNDLFKYKVPNLLNQKTE